MVNTRTLMAFRHAGVGQSRQVGLTLEPLFDVSCQLSGMSRGYVYNSFNGLGDEVAWFIGVIKILAIFGAILVCLIPEEGRQ